MEQYKEYQVVLTTHETIENPPSRAECRRHRNLFGIQQKCQYTVVDDLREYYGNKIYPELIQDEAIIKSINEHRIVGVFFPDAQGVGIVWGQGM
jgi:hypothetical protein